jgi:hypothetical protein
MEHVSLLSVLMMLIDWVKQKHNSISKDVGLL